MINFFVENFCVEFLFSIIENFVSRSFKFGIHQEMLTRTQFFSQPEILHVSHYVFHMHTSCSWSDLHSVMSAFVPTSSVKSWKLLITKFALEGDIKFWGAVLLSNMVIQIALGFCGEIRTLGTIQCFNWTPLLVTRKIKFVVWVAQLSQVTFSFRLSEGISIIGVWQNSLKWT